MRGALLLMVFCGALRALQAQIATITVTGTVSVVRSNPTSKTRTDNSNVVVWLRTLHNAASRRVTAQNPTLRPRFKILQQHKRFDPHVLAIPVGSVVDFPNLDPFFHNVFSLFDGKRFDLGLYEAGASHAVNFDVPGICYIFCNIHSEMSAVVVVLDSPYYAISDSAGNFSIPNVPPGPYFLSVWHERGKPEHANDYPREITISAETAALKPIHLVDVGEVFVPHKNKYGRDYDHDSEPIYK